MSESVRPKRVVILDADNPMEEIHGEFFWREDHEQIVDAVRQRAYEDGFRDGVRAEGSRPINVVLRPRRRMSRLRLMFFMLLFAAFIAVLIQNWHQ
ncbi:MAG: hypothetical protein JWR52_1166 [Marmoricola sp.]|nr:hypothetical protein [Marmoricola sp.]